MLIKKTNSLAWLKLRQQELREKKIKLKYLSLSSYLRIQEIELAWEVFRSIFKTFHTGEQIDILLSQ